MSLPARSIGQSLSTLYAYPNGNTSGVVVTSVFQGNDGRLYGASPAGGSQNMAMVFAVNADGTGFVVLHSFPYVYDAKSLFQGADGRLYGYGSTAANGSFFATIFAINPDGTGFATLHTFLDGGTVEGLVQSKDGRIFGAEALTASNSWTLFAINSDGSAFVPLYSASSAATVYPNPYIFLQGADGRLYGTVGYAGFPLTAPVVFAINPDGTGFTPLFSCEAASLLQGCDGRLYGVTQGGGAYGYGTVFKANLNSSEFLTLHDFTNGADGGWPIYLIEGVDGQLYGTTELVPGSRGAVPNAARMFVLNKAGANFSSLYVFSSSYSPLSIGSNGVLYGGMNATIYAYTLPLITYSPGAQTVPAGSTGLLSVGVSVPGLTYQWSFNGTPIAGATTPTLQLPNIGTAQAGQYRLLITTGPTSGISVPATISVSVDARLMNLSARSYVGPGSQNLVAGFSASGPNPKQLLIRAVGPTLGQYSVAGTLAAPQLTLFDGAAATIATDVGWGNSPVIGSSSTSATISAASSSVFTQVQAFPLPTGSPDSSMVASLPSASYTAQVSGVGNTVGVALAELYDLDSGSAPARVVNLSARAFSGPGSQVVVAGFVVGGNSSETLLIRAVGPTLAQYGILGALVAPQLTLFDSDGKIIATNVGWSNSPSAGSSPVQSYPLVATPGLMSKVYAFSLPAGSNDCAMVITLPPGAYTAQVNGVSGATGIVLVEVYDVP